MSYARWDRDYWEGEVREAIGRDREAYEVWHWLVASKSASSVGVFRPSWRTLATQAYLDGPDQAKAAVARLARLIPGSLRVRDGWVWVVNCAAKQHSPVRSDADRVKRGAELRQDIATAKASPFWCEFFDAYREHLCLRASEGHPKISEWHQDGHPRRPEGLPEFQDGHTGTSDGHPADQEGLPTPSPTQPYPALPSPAQNRNSSSFALDRTHTHATPLAAAALTPDHDPWPEQASRAAADAYVEIRRSEGVEPYSDVCEPFERAAIMLRDRLNIPAEKVSSTLERIVRHASTDPAVRRARAGDLFRSTFYLLGNPSPKGAGVPMVDKLRRHLEDLAQHDAKTAAPPLRHGAKRPTTWDDELQLSRLILTEERFAAWLAAEVVPDTYGPDQLLYRPAGWDERAASAQVDEVGM